MKKFFIIFIAIFFFFAITEIAFASEENSGFNFRGIWKKVSVSLEKIWSWTKNLTKGDILAKIKNWWIGEKQLVRDEFQKEWKEIKEDFKKNILNPLKPWIELKNRAKKIEEFIP